MDLLQMLMGAGSKRHEYEDFIDRYDQGPPWEGYSDQEVLDRYGSVAHNVTQTDYEEAARESFKRLSSEQRAELARGLQQQMQSRGINEPAMPSSNERDMGDVGWLSRVTAQVHQQPGLLRELLGGMSGESGQPTLARNILANPLAKAALAGITTMIVKRAMGRE